ncbi:MAG: site-specific DNA-methyltransferase [Deltaproteobacteria bacterium]|nr:site-specific DNA-methyltransferase [Deltaproteobacteria bacterium]
MSVNRLGLLSLVVREPHPSEAAFVEEIENFSEFGKATQVAAFPDPAVAAPVYINEFWTAKQRAAHSLHEISYRACFKPQLPRFFIERLTKPGEVVYDPFMGRGTTLLEAALLGRVPYGCDINPLSDILSRPRLQPPQMAEVKARLEAIDYYKPVELVEDLLVFYHPETLRDLINLRAYLLDRAAAGEPDPVDAWIRMVATNRLTGHSRGFFSVYTMPPNQAVSVASQQRINARRQQVPPVRQIAEIILKKSRSLLKGLTADDRRVLKIAASEARLITGSCDSSPEIPDRTVSLVVTSPPFLDVVDYRTDNWLRCWFNGLDASQVPIWQYKKPSQWQEKMQQVFAELRRVLRPGGHVAFEVGEVKGGRLLLETLVVPAAQAAGLTPLMVIINDQAFTKTANCWGVDNLKKGTNTNRIVLLQKR